MNLLWVSTVSVSMGLVTSGCGVSQYYFNKGKTPLAPQARIQEPTPVEPQPVLTVRPETPKPVVEDVPPPAISLPPQPMPAFPASNPPTPVLAPIVVAPSLPKPKVEDVPPPAISLPPQPMPTFPASNPPMPKLAPIVVAPSLPKPKVEDVPPPAIELPPQPMPTFPASNPPKPVLAPIVVAPSLPKPKVEDVPPPAIELPPTPMPDFPSTPVVPVLCRPSLKKTTRNLRILFMVDNSGSTVKSYGGVPATDPQHKYRVKTIQDFLAEYASKENFTYSFGSFAKDADVFDVSQQSFVGNPASPFGNATDLATALGTYDRAYTDPKGPTFYDKAFEALQSAIENDSSDKKVDYIVVFMSDGIPTDAHDRALPNADAAIAKMIASLQQAAKNRGSLLTVSSVYFGPERFKGIDPRTKRAFPKKDQDEDRKAYQHLSLMAKEGGGQFVDTNEVQGRLSIDDVIVVPGNDCEK